MRTPTCPACDARQQVQDQAAYYRCQRCGQVIHFVNCVCGSQELVESVDEAGTLPKRFLCLNCGQQRRIIPGGGNRLQRAGESLERAGKGIQSFVGSVFLLGVIWLFYQCATAASGG